VPCVVNLNAIWFQLAQSIREPLDQVEDNLEERSRIDPAMVVFELNDIDASRGENVARGNCSGSIRGCTVRRMQAGDGAVISWRSGVNRPGIAGGHFV
jgi:hypothetical protein